MKPLILWWKLINSLQRTDYAVLKFSLLDKESGTGSGHLCWNILLYWIPFEMIKLFGLFSHENYLSTNFIIGILSLAFALSDFKPNVVVSLRFTQWMLREAII